MAARKDSIHSKRVRERIKTTQLAKRLQDNCLAEEPFLTRDQIEGIKYLLNQAIGTPSQSIEHTGADGGPLTVQVIRFADDNAAE